MSLEAVQGRLRLLGLQSLFAEVFYLTSLRRLSELTERNKGVRETLDSLLRLLQDAELGFKLDRFREKRGSGEISEVEGSPVTIKNLDDLDIAVKAESAFSVLSPLLSEGAQKLQELIGATQRILTSGRETGLGTGSGASRSNRNLSRDVDMIRRFAQQALFHLERIEGTMAGSVQMWP